MTVRATLPLFSVAAVFALGAAAARILVAQSPAQLTGAGFTQPLVVVTAWGPLGVGCFAILATTIALAAGACFAATRSLRPSEAGPGAIALAAAAALCAATAWPFVFSSDVYAYAAYGWLAAHGNDPYALVPAALHVPLIDAARQQWQGPFPRCVYGPAFVALARASVSLSGGANPGSALAGLRLVTAAAFIGCVFPLAAALRGAGEPRRTRLVAAFTLNPVMLWSVAEGHNDALLLLAALCGFALLRRGAVAAGAFIVGSSALLKATGLAFATGLALEALAFAKPPGRRLCAALTLGVGLAVACGLPSLLPALAAAGRHGHYTPAASLQSLLGPAPAFALAAAATGYALRRLHGRRRDGYAWLGLAAWIALPNPYPWYALWLLPAAVAARASFATSALYGVTFSSVLRYLPDAAGNIGPSELHWLAALTASPLLLALGPATWRFPFRKISQT